LARAGTEGGTAERDRPAALAAVALLLSYIGWFVAGLVGVGHLVETPEEFGCLQPEVPYGVALTSLAVTGAALAGWGLRSAARYRRRETPGSGLLRAMGAVLLLGVATGWVGVSLQPKQQFDERPCEVSARP